MTFEDLYTVPRSVPPYKFTFETTPPVMQNKIDVRGAVEIVEGEAEGTCVQRLTGEAKVGMMGLGSMVTKIIIENVQKGYADLPRIVESFVEQHPALVRSIRITLHLDKPANPAKVRVKSARRYTGAAGGYAPPEGGIAIEEDPGELDEADADASVEDEYDSEEDVPDPNDDAVSRSESYVYHDAKETLPPRLPPGVAPSTAGSSSSRRRGESLRDDVTEYHDLTGGDLTDTDLESASGRHERYSSRDAYSFRTASEYAASEVSEGDDLIHGQAPPSPGNSARYDTFDVTYSSIDRLPANSNMSWKWRMQRQWNRFRALGFVRCCIVPAKRKVRRRRKKNAMHLQQPLQTSPKAF